jgi:hypothetical protein
MQSRGEAEETNAAVPVAREEQRLAIERILGYTEAS